MWPTNLLYVLLFASGLSGLVLEVTWSRMLTLVFGDTVAAVSTVLAAFMAGLALGSWLGGRRIDSHPNPLRVYAWLELGIGVSVGLLLLAWLGLQPIYVWLYRHWHTVPVLFGVMRFLLGFLLLLLPTTLMGATLPVVSRICIARLVGAVREPPFLGWQVGLIYGVNTAGAVLGCFAAGFWMIGHLGMYQTLAIAMTVNLLVALGAWHLPLRLPPAQAAPSRHPEATAPTRAEAYGLVLLVCAVSGFTALAYEVLWTRALVFFVGNSTYAFSAMLTTFLLGLQRALLLLSGLHVLLGGLLLARQLTVSPFVRAALAAGLPAIVVGTGLLLPALRFRDTAGIAEREVLFYDEDAGGVVKVSRDANGHTIVSVNGWPVAGTAGPSRE